MLTKTSRDARQIETVLSDIQLQIRRLGERDVKSRTIGEIVATIFIFVWIMSAYVRFASVYQDFQDVDAFRHKLNKCNNVNIKRVGIHV